MVKLDANTNGENSGHLKLKPSEYFFLFIVDLRQFKSWNQFNDSKQKIKGFNFPYFFIAFVMDENQVDETSIVGHGNVNEKEMNKMVFDQIALNKIIECCAKKILFFQTKDLVLAKLRVLI